jgi:hypothetical protein
MKIAAHTALPVLLLACAKLGAGDAAAQAAAPQDSARIENIETSVGDDRITILVSFDRQPRGATATMNQGQLLLDLDGITLAPFAFTPPPGAMISRVAASPSGAHSARITLATQAMSAPSATLYRNAVLVELERDERAASAVLARAVPATPAPSSSQTNDAANSKTGASAMGACDKARITLEKDSWNIAALGDHALCLARAGKLQEAGHRLDQLAAFDPGDPRVAEGRKLLTTARESDSRRKVEVAATAQAPKPHADH